MFNCPEPDCGFKVILEDQRLTQVNCAQCGKSWCPKCRIQIEASDADGHFNRTCEEYEEHWKTQERVNQVKEDDEKALEMVKKEGGKQCPSCKIWTLKNEMCNEMKCTQCCQKWCYACGSRRGENNTCECIPLGMR